MALDDILSVKAFGAMGDMKGTAGRDKGTVSVSGPKVILIADKPVFVPEDNRKAIVIWDGNINTREDPLVTKINSVDPDKRTVGLDHPPTKNMDNMSFAWGTDDTDAIQKTLDKAKERGLAVYLPPGHFIVTRALKYITDLVKNDERDKGISYVPNPKLMADHAGQFEVLPVMKPGLRMFGAGMQVSFLHNLITSDSLPDYPPADYPSPRATIIIDGTQGKKIINSDKEAKSWQQTGELRDFHITATGHIKNTVGIDLLATWLIPLKMSQL